MGFNKKLLLFCLCFIACIASAAEFNHSCPVLDGKEQGCQIYMHGEIVPGDSDRLLSVLKSTPPRNALFRQLVLDSPGGDVNEAFKISKLVQDALLETGNYSAVEMLIAAAKRTESAVGYTCASSCVIVLMSGTTRYLTDFKGGRIGLHRPYFNYKTYSENMPPSALADLQRKAMANVQEFLLAEGMPRSLIEVMMNRSSKEIYWLSNKIDIPYVRNTAAWFDEQKISLCSFDPLAESDAVEAINRNDRIAADKAGKRMAASSACVISLVNNAQQKIRVQK